MYRTKSMYSRNSMFKWSEVDLYKSNIHIGMNIFIECMSDKLYVNDNEWILYSNGWGYRIVRMSEVILLSKWKDNRMWRWKI